MFRQKLREWGIPEDDPQINIVVRRIEKIRMRLSDEDWMEVFTTIESIVAAERAKRTFDSEAERVRYMRLIRASIDAANLATQINDLFPLGFENNRPNRELLKALATFISGNIDATALNERNVRLHDARKRLQRTKRLLSAKTGGKHWQLIRDLVWLASKGRADPDERTVRRYQSQHPRFKPPQSALWERHWELIRSIVTFRGTEEEIEAFQESASAYLKTYFLSDLPGKPGAK